MAHNLLIGVEAVAPLLAFVWLGPWVEDWRRARHAERERQAVADVLDEIGRAA